MTESSSPYLHGFSPVEQARLIKQARLLESTLFNHVDYTGVRRLLEVGSGVGAQTEILLRRFPDLRVTGIDLSREMLEKAAERVTNERLPNVDGLLEMDAEAMAFQDGAFDMAVAMFTASVVPNARQLYAEMSRVVRPGGRLLFVNHFAAEAGPRWWVERAMAPLSRVLGWHPDFELSALLDRETAEIEAIEPCPPAGLFTLVQLRNGDTLRRALAA